MSASISVERIAYNTFGPSLYGCALVIDERSVGHGCQLYSIGHAQSTVKILTAFKACEAKFKTLSHPLVQLSECDGL